jgi:hypothetical protein
MEAGSSTKTALGRVSAGGAGTPELDVTHVALDQPVGSAGGVTPSKNSRRRKMGSHCPSTRSFPSIASSATVLVSPTAAPATRNRQQTSRSRVRMNVRFGFVATELAVSFATSSFRRRRTAARQWQLLCSASLKRLYHFMVALWRETALRLFLSMPDHFAGLCGDQGGSDFSIAGVLGRVRANNVTPPSTL